MADAPLDMGMEAPDPGLDTEMGDELVPPPPPPDSLADDQVPWSPDQPMDGAVDVEEPLDDAGGDPAIEPPGVVAGDDDPLAPPPPGTADGPAEMPVPPEVDETEPLPGLADDPGSMIPPGQPGGDEVIDTAPEPGTDPAPAPEPQPVDALDEPPPPATTPEPAGEPPVAPDVPNPSEPGSVIPPGQPGGDEPPVTDPERDPTAMPIGEADPPEPDVDVDITEPSPAPDPVAATEPSFDYDTQHVTPGSIPADAAGSLLAGLAPDADADLSEVLRAITDRDGEVDVASLLTELDELGVRHVTGEEVGAQGIEDLLDGADGVNIIGHIGDQTLTLNVSHVEETGTMVFTDPQGLEYEGRVEDVNRAWHNAGAPLLTSATAPPAAPSGLSAPRSAPLDDVTALADEELPPLNEASLADPDNGGISPAALGLGAAVLVPAAIGGGILARRLTRQSS